MLTLPHQEGIVAAAIFFRIGTADRRAMLIDRTAALGFVQELAGAFKDGVFAVTQDIVAIARDIFRKLLFGLLEIKAKSFTEPDNIAFGHRNPVIVATIGGTFRTVVPELRLLDMTILLQNWELFFCHSIRSRLEVCSRSILIIM
jgi:hypothetical protein